VSGPAAARLEVDGGHGQCPYESVEASLIAHADTELDVVRQFRDQLAKLTNCDALMRAYRLIK
jgi:hypothetical protein